MIPVRVNSFSENGLGEPEQDANTALTELDKGLRSGKVGEQCEAIVRFPRLFEKYPFPILINASLLKLADLFRIGNNFLRVWVLQVCQQSEKHLDKILNVDEFVRRIYSVIHSNDPVARALTLRTLGSVAGIIPERQQVHHSIRRSLDSHDTVEVEAAIYAAMQFAAQSKTFALSMCNKISDMIQGLATPANMKLQLIPILQHMHHDTHSAALVRQLCTELLPSYPAQEFVSVTLKTLTQLAAATLVDIPSQVTLLLEYLREDPRWAVKAQVVRDLRALAEVGAHLWPAGAVEALLEVADATPYELLLSRILDILLVLAKSAATCQAQLGSDSPLMSLCERSSYSVNPTVAAKAVQVMTDVVCYCSREDVAHDVDRAVDTVELLFLAVAPSEDCSRQLSTCLRCAVRLCQHRPDFGPRFVQLLGAQLVIQDLHRALLCEALGAIGGFQAGALVPVLPDLLQLLQTCQDSRAKVMLCTLVFQTMVTYEWPLEMRKTLEAVSEKADLWANYRIARSAARYGHHGVAANIFSRLQENVASEQLHFWLVSLEALCRGETALQGGQLPGTVQRIETAITHCCKATAALKAASTPAHSLQFATDYTRLRGEFLQCLVQLAHTCHSLCTAPPPAVASSVAESSRDQLQRFGHVTSQLRKCVKDFRSCGEMYWKLYQSAFDADPSSLANIQILQQMCVLMAHTLERVSQATYQEDPVLDFSDSIYQQSNLETQHLVKRCQQASALAQQLPQTDGPKVISHQHAEILLRQVEVLSQTPLYIPRFFFQVLQSTSVKLAISPQPRVPGEPIAVQSGSQLAVKVEGVILHGRRWAGRFRHTAAVTVTVSCQLQQPRTAQLQPDTKIGETTGGSVLTQTVSPHRDYFTAQFLLAFPVGGQYTLLVEAAVVDEHGDIWRTGPRASMAVKAHEGGDSKPAAATSGGRFHTSGAQRF